jgi:putative phosphoesterase
LKSVAIIADIHSNIIALQEVMKSVKKADHILCAGDLVGYNPWPNESIRLIQEKGIHSIMGNHDAVIVDGSYDTMNPQAKLALQYTHKIISEENIEYLNSLSKKFTIQIEDVTLCAYHGSPLHPLRQYVYPWAPRNFVRTLVDMIEGNVLILGHTHIPMMFNFNDKLLINPGSVGQPRDKNPQASYMILQIEGSRINVEHHRVDYNIDVVMSKIVEEGLPLSLAHRLKKGI